jgi:hypothetical protein
MLTWTKTRSDKSRTALLTMTIGVVGALLLLSPRPTMRR